MSNSSNRVNLSFVSEGPFHVVMTGNEDEELIDDEQYQYISPPYETSKSPMHDSPSLVKPEEIIIVGGVLILWISVIALFIHKWGKIRGLEPYIPHFDRTSLHTHSSSVTGGTVVTGSCNQVSGLGVQTMPAANYPTVTVNTSSTTVATNLPVGQVGCGGGVKVNSDPSNTAGDTSDTSQASHQTVKRYNSRPSNKGRINLTSKPRKLSGKDKWTHLHNRTNQSSSSSIQEVDKSRKRNAYALHTDTEMQANSSVDGFRDRLASKDDLQVAGQTFVHNSSCNDYLESGEYSATSSHVKYSPVNRSINSSHLIDSSRRKNEDRLRRKKSREYFYPYSPRRPRASIDSSSITAQHIIKYSLNSPVISDERLLQSHPVDFDQAPYLRHKQTDLKEGGEDECNDSLHFNSVDSKHLYHSIDNNLSSSNDKVICDEDAGRDIKEISDKTSGHKNKSHVYDSCEQFNVSFISNGNKHRRLRPYNEIYRECRSYIDIPSLVLLRMASSEPNIAESRFDS